MARGRLEGARRAAEAAGLDWPAVAVEQCQISDVESGRAGAHALLDRAPGTTALFALSDPLALGARIAARERGLSVPGDLSIVGFDDSAPEAEGLTTIHQPLREKGRAGTELLLRMLAGDERPPHDAAHTPRRAQLDRAAAQPHRSIRHGGVMDATLADPATPFAVLDRARLERNVRRLGEHLAGLGVPLRLHVKTAKSVDVASVVFGGGTGPITVSTLAEAEQFADAGYTDIVYPVGHRRVEAPARAGAAAARRAADRDARQRRAGAGRRRPRRRRSASRSLHSSRSTATASVPASRPTTRPWSRSPGSWPTGPSCAGC